ncbi:MAG: hypothetical protein ABI670_09505 [Chloroflexota bacterium]
MPEPLEPTAYTGVNAEQQSSEQPPDSDIADTIALVQYTVARFKQCERTSAPSAVNP